MAGFGNAYRVGADGRPMEALSQRDAQLTCPGEAVDLFGE